MTNTEHANTILAFIQNIDNENDAIEFVRIALEALEAMSEHINEEFNRQAVLDIISEIDNRIGGSHE